MRKQQFGLVLICALGAPLWLGAPLGAVVPPDLSAGVKAYDSGDYSAALRIFKPAAQKGSAEAQYDLGVMYQRGNGVSKVGKDGFKCLRQAADQGLPETR